MTEIRGAFSLPKQSAVHQLFFQDMRRIWIAILFDYCRCLLLFRYSFYGIVREQGCFCGCGEKRKSWTGDVSFQEFSLFAFLFFLPQNNSFLTSILWSCCLHAFLSSSFFFSLFRHFWCFSFFLFFIYWFADWLIYQKEWRKKSRYVDVENASETVASHDLVVFFQFSFRSHF